MPVPSQRQLGNRSYCYFGVGARCGPGRLYEDLATGSPMGNMADLFDLKGKDRYDGVKTSGTEYTNCPWSE
jgi:hypothetical protein